MEEGMLPLSTRNVYPSCLLPQVEEEALGILQEYIRHTGQKDGALSMQFFWKPGKGIQVCEIAGRFFGYEHELTEIVYGFSIEELLLNWLYEKEKIPQMFQNHDIHKPLRQGAVIYFQGRNLEIADQSAARELAKREGVIKAWIFYQDGEHVVEYGPNPYLALYYTAGNSRKELDALTESFYREMSIRDPQGREIVYQNKIPEYRSAQESESKD